MRKADGGDYWFRVVHGSGRDFLENSAGRVEIFRNFDLFRQVCSGRVSFLQRIGGSGQVMKNGPVDNSVLVSPLSLVLDYTEE
jgi:hypothetical protein